MTTTTTMTAAAVDDNQDDSSKQQDDDEQRRQEEDDKSRGDAMNVSTAPSAETTPLAVGRNKKRRNSASASTPKSTGAAAAATAAASVNRQQMSKTSNDAADGSSQEEAAVTTASSTLLTSSKRGGGGVGEHAAAASSKKENSSQTMTQESFQQPTQASSDILTQNPESTQLGGDDDDDDDGEGFIFSPFSPSTRRQLPWARIILPQGGEAARGIGNSAAARQQASVDLIPRAAAAASSSTTSNSNREVGGISFLGLDNLQPGDPFNEYVIGRSSHADIMAVPPPSSSSSSSSSAPPTTTTDAEQDEEAENKKKAERKVQEWTFSMISNRHCRIFCSLENTTQHHRFNKGGNNNMQVYVEDTSGNGTLINKTTLLRKGEKRLLHSGDEICLVNPQTLRKKIRSKTLLQSLLQQHSFVFINLLSQQQQLQQSALLASSQTTTQSNSSTSRPSMMMMLPPPSFAAPCPPSASSSTASAKRRKAAVNVRAMNHHSRGGGGGFAGLLKNPLPSPALHHHKQQRQQHHSPLMMQPLPLAPPPAAAFAANSNSNGAFSSSFRGRPPPPSGKPKPSAALATASSRTTQEAAKSVRRPRPRRVEQDYDIRDLLGIGTVGQVRRAVHRQTGQERAVKTMTFHANANSNNMMNNQHIQSTTELFQAEAAILQGLDHPYIVRLLDVYVSDTAVHLVMDLLPGGDLFDRIVSKGKYSEVESRRVMRRLLAAVSYLHEECNIVHRDLKPENILLVSRDNDVQVQITDFGLAKPVQGNGVESCKTFCGTPQYFAPEVLRRRHSVQKRGRYGKPADQWSLGVILYVLLSGTPPFEVSHFGNLLVGSEFDIEFPDEHWAGVSESAKDLVRKLLVADPQKRWTVGQAMRHEWINTNDGDSHVFPLDDPKLKVVKAAASAAASATAATTKQKAETAAQSGEQLQEQVFQKRLFTAVTGKATRTAAAADASAPGTAASIHKEGNDTADTSLSKKHDNKSQQRLQDRSESTQISPESALAGAKKRNDLEPSSAVSSKKEPGTANNNSNSEEEDHAPPHVAETTTTSTSTTNIPPRVSDVAPSTMARDNNNNNDNEPRRPLSPTSFNINRQEMMKAETDDDKNNINSSGGKVDTEQDECSSSAMKSHEEAPTLLFGSGFGRRAADPPTDHAQDKDTAHAAPESLANQPILEKDDILSEFSEKTESIGSFGGNGDSMGSLGSKKAAAADVVVARPEPRRSKKRKEEQPSNNSTTQETKSVGGAASPKRRRVSALVGDSLASLSGPKTSANKATTTKKVKSKASTSKQRNTTTRKTKEHGNGSTKSKKANVQQTTLSAWFKK